MKHKTTLFSLLTLALVLGTAGAAVPTEDGDAAVIEQQRYSYPLDVCPVSGEKFTEESPAVSFVVEGRLVRTCCPKCEKKVKADPQKYIAKIDAAVIEQQLPLYPLDKCVVSGEELGSAGKPVELVRGTRLVRLCCKDCIKTFDKDPGKYMARIDEAMIAKQRESYPFQTCVVSGEALDSMGKPIDRLYGTTLVRMCCKGCIKEFEKSPEKFLTRIHEAREAASRG